MPNFLPDNLDAAIVRMTKMLYDAAPGNTLLVQWRALGNETAVSAALNANFASDTNAQWAARIATNLHLTGNSFVGAQAFLLGNLNNGMSRAALLAGAAKGLAGLENDGAWGAAAAYFNASTAASYIYSLNPANTSTDLAGAVLRAADEPNSAPVAVADTAAAVEGGGVVAGTVAANDSDPDGNALTYALAVSQAPVAGLTFGSNGAYTFDPSNAAYNDIKAGATRVITVSYVATDGSLSTGSTLTITVTGTNDAPIAQAVTVSGNEDTSINVTPSVVDPDIGDTLTYAVTGNPLHGTATYNSGTGKFVYVPAANYNGTDTFAYTVTDGSGASTTALATVFVGSVNDAPIAAAKSVQGLEDSAGIAASPSSTDSDAGDTATFAVNTQPANGSVSFNGASFIYVPNPNFNGVDTFTYSVTDSAGAVGTATITVTVASVNDAPVANSGTASGTEDNAIGGTVSASDVDTGDTKTFALNSQPSRGTVTINATTGAYVYTPNANYNGTDSFTFKVTDTAGATSTAAVSIVIGAVNDAPVAANVVSSGLEDAAGIAVSPSSSDVDAGDTATYSVNSQPANGSVSFNGTNFVYVPNANFNGTDSFTYKVTDAAGATSTATATITVGAVNDAPVAATGTASTSEDTAVAGTVTSSDVDTGDTKSYALNSQAAHGTVTINASTGAYVYTPAANYNGTDSFSFKVTDAAGATSNAVVSIAVSSVNDAPVAANVAASGLEDAAAILVAPSSTDVDAGDTAAYTVVTQPANGTVSFNGTNFVYIPNADFNGTNTFTYRVTDGAGATSTATATVTVGAVNDAPVAAPGTALTNEDTAVSGTVTASDVDTGDTKTFALTGQAAHGTVTLSSAGAYTYTPAANYNGTDSFTFKVTDSAGAISSNTVSISITAVNDAPIALALSATGSEDQAIAGQVGATDVDGDTQTYVVVSQPTNGTVTMNADGSFVYTPAPNYYGTDSFTFQSNDGHGANSNVATVSLTIASVPDALTTGVDSFVGSVKDDAWVGNQSTLNAGDSITGGAGNDSLTVNVNGAGGVNYSAFALNGVELFEVTNDTNPADGATSFDMSSSSGVQTLRSTNSTNDVNFNYANLNFDHGGGGTTNLDALNLTQGVSVSLDVRNDDITGSTDTVNIHVTDSDDDNSRDVNQINIVAAAMVAPAAADQNTPSGIEIVNLSTADSSGNVRIDDLNTPGTTNLNISTAVNVTIGDTDFNTGAFENALSGSINNIQAGGATGNISLSTEDNDIGVVIVSGAGNDTYVTGDGPDSVMAGAGGDYVRTGHGNDTVYGEAGNDTIDVGHGHNYVDGGTGNDNITSGTGWDTIVGGDGNDVISAGNGNNIVTGGEGNDNITVGTGDDSVDGGNGDDTVNISAGGSDSVQAGAGNDVINAGASLESSYTEFTFPGIGADWVDGGTGIDTLNLTGDSGDANELDGVKNVEQINISGEDFDTNVTDGSWFDTDTTLTTVEANALTGRLYFNGNDGGVGGSGFGGDGPFNSIGASDDGLLSRAISVFGSGGNDTIITGVGADSIRGRGGNDLINTGAGNDSVAPGTGTDNVALGAGDDVAIFADNGADQGTLDVNDVIDGGPLAGNDTIRLDIQDQFNNGFSDPTTVATLGAGISNIDTVLINDLDNVVDYHQVNVTLDATFAQTGITIDGRALDSDEVFVVDASANASNENVTIFGGAANDYIYMGDNLGAADSIDGGAGGNTLSAQTTADGDFANVRNISTYQMAFGGNDTAQLGSNAQAAGINVVYDNAGNDVLNASSYTAALNVYANSGGNDTLTTGSGADYVSDNAGNDSITTNAGNDTILAGSGNDTVNAGADNDLIDGLLGDDVVNAGTGDDVIVGYGNQVSGTDLLNGGAGNDTLELNDAQGNVNATITLSVPGIDSFTGVETITAVDNDDDNANNLDGSVNFGHVTNITVTGGNVATLTTININGRGYNGAAYGTGGDRLNVDLSALGDKDFAFNITGGTAADTVTGSALPENLNFQAGAGDDRLNVDATDLGTTLTMDGGAGTDTINMISGVLTDDSFDHISRIEHLTAAGGLVPLNAALGAVADAALDETTLGYITVTGTAGNDSLILDSAYNDNTKVNLSAGGNDSVNAGASTSTVTIYADVADIDGADTLTGGTGASDLMILTADNGSMSSTGTTGFERINIAESGDASATLNIANGMFTAVTGAVITVDASALDDTGQFDTTEGSLTLNAGGVTVGAFNVTGGTGADSITTGSGNDTINGGADNTPWSAAADTIDSGAGNDSITTTGGNDSITAGTGNDTVNAGNGNNTVWGGDGTDNITTGTGADSIDGGTGADTISSGAGDDIVFGGTGNGADSIDAGAGNDQIAGDDIDSAVGGADTINGGTGSDVIIGGAGADRLSGGGADSATDIFMYTRRSDSSGLLANIDTITDFQSGQDVIDFRYVGLDPALPGLSGKTIFFGGNAINYADATAAVHNGNNIIEVVYQQDEQVLWVDLNDDGSLDNNDLRIKVVTNNGSMAAGDVMNGFTMGPIHVSNGQNVTGSIANDYYIVDGAGPVTINGVSGNDTIESNAAGGTVFAPGTTFIGGANNDTLILHHLDDITNVAISGIENITIANSSVRMTTAQWNAFATINDGDAATPDQVTFSTGGTVVGDADIETYVLEAATNISFAGPHDVTDAPGTTGYTVVGSAGADTITGNSGADSLAGGGGADWIDGGAGADSVDGGSGNDTIIGAQNDALLAGGTNTDELRIGAAFNDTGDGQITGVESVVITASGLTTVLDNQTEGMTVTGTAGADTIVGGSGADTISSGDGNDSINATVGADSVDAGDGWDTIEGSDTAALLDGGANSNQIIGFVSTPGYDTLLTGASFNDTSDAQIQGIEIVTMQVAGLLDLASQSEDMSVNGSSGNDTIVDGGGEDMVHGNGGADSITGSGGEDWLYGDAGNDTIVGTDFDHVIDGGSGTDTLQIAGYFSDDSDEQIVSIESIVLTGSDQGVYLDEQTENLSVTGSAGNDTITTGSGNDTINAGAGNDSIDGGAGADRLRGEAGDDSIFGAQNDTLLDGGADTDILFLQDSFDDTTNSQIANIELVWLVNGDTQVDLTSQTEGMSVFGSKGNDSIQAGQGVDTVVGWDGADSLDGGAGADEVYGSFGNDTIVGAQNDTVMDGGEDTDTLELDAAFDDTGDSQIANIEIINITYDGGVSVILDNQTEGFTINGGAGNDTITGGSGADSILGGNGADLINGGSGNDTLIGGAGNDTLIGGAGADAYMVDAGTDTIDNIDWNPGLGDTLTVSVGATASIPGSGAADTVNVSTATNNGTIVISVGNGNDTVTGSSGADSILAGSGNDSVTAGAGNDTVNAGDGNDWISGGAGNDVFDLGDLIDASDTINGGADSDTLNMANVNGNWADGVTNVEIINWTNDNGFADDLTTIDALVAAGATLTINMTGSGAGNTYYVDGSAETDGHFVMNGGGSNDTLIGGAIADTLMGGAGADSLVGGAGADSLNGGEGADTLAGGTGADTINLTETVSAADTVQFTLLAGATNTAVNADNVIGFNVANDILSVGQVGALQTITSIFGGFDLLATAASGYAVEIASTVGTVASLSAVAVDGDVEGLIAFAIANVKTGASTFAAGDNLTVVLYNAAGDAGIYNVNVSVVDADLGTQDFEVDLIAIVQGVGANNIADGNLS